MSIDEPPARRPAPGGLRLVQDFCNSTDFEAGFDLIGDPPGLSGWLAAAGFALPTQASDVDVTRAIAFREALRDAVSVSVGDAASPGEVSDRVGRGRAHLAAEAASLPLVVAFGEGIELRPVLDGLAGAMGSMLAALAVGEVDGTTRRLKACEAHSCRWVFYDQSRNGSSRWCAMGLCGARSKNRAYRRRRRESTAAG